MDKFFNDLQKANKKPTTDSEDTAAPEKKALPKGVVLGKDGKPYVYLLQHPFPPPPIYEQATSISLSFSPKK